MREGVASRTAVWVSLWRGLGGFDRSVESDDPVAKELLPARYRALLHALELAPGVSRAALAGIGVVSGGLSRHVPFRTRAIDESVAAGVSEGATQIVLLGAGLDARAYRLDGIEEATVFEVDHPDTQAAKRRRASRLPPKAKEVVYVAVDFAKDDLATELTRAGHDPSRPTAFVWEGVTMYLPRVAIEGTLATLSARAAPGSRLAMTYYDATAMLAERLTHPLFGLIGEPLVTRLSPAQAAELLAKHGFDVTSDEGDAEWGERFVGHAGFARISERLACAKKRGH